MIDEVINSLTATEKPAKRAPRQRRAGQIVTRGENRHLIRVYLGRDAGGKRLYHNHTFRGTKKDAQKWLNSALRRLDMGEPIEQSGMLFDEFLDRWLDLAVKPRVRERSHDDYSFIVHRHVKPALGKKRLLDIKPLDLQTLYSALQGKGLSGKTVRTVHMVISNALKQAVRWEMIRVNPATMVDPPKSVRKEMNVMSPDQARAFLKAAATDRHGAMFAFALTTGARPEEYFALKWSDVDWQARTVTIQRTLLWRYKPARWKFEKPKTTSAYRTLPLNESLIKQLKEHKRRQGEDRLLAGADWQNNDLVFPKYDGSPFELSTLRLFFQRLLKSAELPTNFRVYDLRHTCATVLLSEGVNPKIVSERLGHANIVITLQVYSHVLPNMQSEASEKLEKALFAGVGTL